MFTKTQKSTQPKKVGIRTREWRYRIVRSCCFRSFAPTLIENDSVFAAPMGRPFVCAPPSDRRRSVLQINYQPQPHRTPGAPRCCAGAGRHCAAPSRSLCRLLLLLHAPASIGRRRATTTHAPPRFLCALLGAAARCPPPVACCARRLEGGRAIIVETPTPACAQGFFY